MTTEQMIEVMTAFTKGVAIEVLRSNGSWEQTACPIWNWSHCKYRIKPSKKLVPLTPADIPPVCWLRTHTDFSRAYLVGLVAQLEVAITDYSRNERVSYDRLFETHWEYSSDRVNWRPCCKEVEQ